jgi:phosphoglycolate phosphatase
VSDPAGFLVVFDLDGTLIDSARDLADAGNALLAGYGSATLPQERIVRMVGDGARELVRRLLTASALDVPLDDALARFLREYNDRLLATTRPYDGVVEMLARVSPIARLAVLTNKPEYATRRLLDSLELARFFADVIGGDTAMARKPDPAGLLSLVGRARLTSARALMVGDSVADLRTAAAAGVPACLARYGFGFAQIPDEERALAAHEVNRPSEVAAIVERLAGPTSASRTDLRTRSR